MKKIILIQCIALLFLLACTNKKDKLIEKLNIYKECFKTKDYIKMSSMVLPSIIEEAGGTDKFVEMMNEALEISAEQGIHLDISKLEVGDPGKLYKKNDYLISVIPTKLPIEINSSKGEIESSIIGFSEDNGATWFFIEGDDEGRSSIANTNPEIIQMINVPTPKLTINNKTLYQKNGQWE